MRKDKNKSCQRHELFEKLSVAQVQSATGKKGITHKQMMTKLRQRVRHPSGDGDGFVVLVLKIFTTETLSTQRFTKTFETTPAINFYFIETS